jgi:hypothetical protein
MRREILQPPGFLTPLLAIRPGVELTRRPVSLRRCRRLVDRPTCRRVGRIGGGYRCGLCVDDAWSKASAQATEWFGGDAVRPRHQHMSHRGEPSAELIGVHGGGAGDVGKEVELARVDAVALERHAVSYSCPASCALRPRRDDETGVTPRSDRLHDEFRPSPRGCCGLGPVSRGRAAARVCVYRPAAAA